MASEEVPFELRWACETLGETLWVTYGRNWLGRFEKQQGGQFRLTTTEPREAVRD